jgi:hypothetical protein
VYFRDSPYISSPLSETEYYSGFTQRRLTENKDQIDLHRRELRLEMEFLNTLASMLKSDLSEQKRRDFKYRSESIKLLLMKTVWGSDWGDFDEFKVWVESGTRDSVPKGLEVPATYYHIGLEMVK